MLLSLLSNGLACYRLARLITKEAGPFDVFHHLRSAVGVYDYGADGRSQSTLNKLFDCPYCTGVWVALLLTLCPEWQVKKFIVSWLAVAGFQAALQNWTEDD
jgi:hypothetical protein